MRISRIAAEALTRKLRLDRIDPYAAVHGREKRMIATTSAEALFRAVMRTPRTAVNQEMLA